ncbi:MAG: DNA polymerase III subunit delta [Candidatus Omnitrophota bacterium]
MNYLIVGDDEYIKKVESVKIKNKFLSSGQIDLNYSVHEAGNVKDIIDSLETVPFLSEKRVIFVKGEKGISDELITTFLAYFKRNITSSVLILSADAAFKKTKHYSQFVPFVNVIMAEKPSPQTLRNWIHAFLKKEGVEISSAAVELIVELKGQDAAFIKKELDKLICYSNQKKITVEDVENVVGRSISESVFKLVDAVNADDAPWAFRVLNDLYDQKKQPHEILGYISWHIRIMQKTAYLSKKGDRLEQIAAELGYSLGYTRKLVDQSKKYSLKKLNQWVALIFEKDKEIKTGRIQPFLAIEMLLTTFLCRDGCQR